MARSSWRVGSDVEALFLSFCTARPVAAISGCCRESFTTSARYREHWTWRYVDALFCFAHAEDQIETLALQAEARAERRAYSEWVRELQEL